ncbi:nuclease-related domain-containing protein [Rossellomorea oryzaecorticis]|uniref:Nuclease-related domain-containing protein n=1 Tax=Rossellomorea oryzaecorticis TaxID=1396505 RepID=A0ABU9KAH9_9BACI
MIIKGRKIPLIILYKEALLRRITQNSPYRPKIKEDLLKYWSGYHGECMVDRHLSTIDTKNFYILNDLHIPIGDTSFQIDSLLIFKSLALIIEVKNISGSLSIGGEFNQFSRTTNVGITMGFTNPVSQAKRYTHHLKQWLKDKGYFELPVEFLVVFTNPAAVLTGLQNSNRLEDHIIKVEDLIKKITDIQMTFSKSFLDDRETKQLVKKLLKAHVDFPIITKTEETIFTGVQCVTFMNFGMERKKASWYCSECNSYDKNVHEKAIFDYFLLVKPTINNSPARAFLHLSSPKITHILLTSMNLVSLGKNKAKHYITPFHAL